MICPLNWGLGHATRDVPIIEILLKNNFEVIIAASEEPMVFLKNEFPDIEIINFPNYKVRYSKQKSQLLRMTLLIPKIFICTIIEHIKIKRLIKQNNIDIIISDNRFGLWNKHIYSIFITHQLKVKFPRWLNFLEFIYKNLLKLIINKYDECWVPDFEGSINLSGELSHLNKSPKNIKFIGPLSRFALLNNNEHNKNVFDLLFILSGPEPQRTLLEGKIYKQTQNCNLRMAIVRGTEKQATFKFTFPTYDLLNTNSLYDLIMTSDKIISRSGYSSIMDLVALNKKAILIPTPGQTEQEYLAKYLQEKNLFFSMSQEEFDLSKAINTIINTPDFKLIMDNKNLLERILELKDK